MLRRFNAIYRRNVRHVASAVFGVLFIVWIASLWLPFLQDWLTQRQIMILVLAALVAQVIALLLTRQFAAPCSQRSLDATNTRTSTSYASMFMIVDLRRPT